MRKIGKTLSGNILIEMSVNEWQEVVEHNGIPKDLSAAVVQYRMENGLTQMELAQKIGISRTRVQEIERGLSRNMRLRTYERVLLAIS
jgi:DNA-binding XRE family transcriptional regulator